MGYIRTIKASFFTSEDIVSLTPLARLLYIALWTEADREGRLTWRPGTFKLRFLPGDNCDIHDLCKELVDSGLVVTYAVDSITYAEIPTFTRHQVINNRESKSSLPPRVIDAIGTRADASASRDDVTGTPLVGKERKGKEVHAPRCVAGAGDDGFAEFWSAYPKKKAKADAQKAWAKLNPGRLLLPEILAALDRQKAGDDWRKDGGRFIPNPATWINGRRWEDETAGTAATGDERADLFAGAI